MVPAASNQKTPQRKPEKEPATMHDTPHNQNTQEPNPNPLRQGLLPQHKALLQASGISERIVAERGYQSIVLESELRNLKPPANFNKSQRITPALLIPTYNVHGNPQSYILRPDAPRKGPKGKRIKYENMPGNGNHLDILPSFRDSRAVFDQRIPIVICEGVRKADSAASNLDSIVAIALNGVYGFRGALPGDNGAKGILPDFSHLNWKDRLVYICFDSDVMTNRKVHAALLELRRALQSYGALVRFVYLPALPDGGKVGLDDFFGKDELSGTTREEKQIRFASLISEELREPDAFDKTQPINDYRLSDLGNAERLVDSYGEVVRYCEEWGKFGSWLVWDGTRWNPDRTSVVHRYAQSTIRAIYEEVAKSNDYETKRALSKHALASESDNRLNAMVSRARKHEDVVTTLDIFDQNSWLLNCRNGTIDLTSGVLLPHDQADHITRLAPVDYDPHANQSDWLEFIDLVTQGDEAMMRYLQRVIGYCLSGSAKEGSFFYVKGPTRTGKSTFLEAVSGVLGLGEYAWKTPFDLILSGRRPGGPRDDIAALAGRRLIIASEAGHNQMIDTSVLKELTGEDTINARHLYEGAQQIRPTYKLMFAANEFPYASVNDDAVWARLHLILFENVGASDRRYLDLKHRVRDIEANGSAILAWAVEGCLGWQEDDDLLTPDSVRVAAKAQRDELSPIQALLSAEHTTIDSNLREKYGNLWERYKYIVKQENIRHSLGKQAFGRELTRRGFLHMESGSTFWRIGLKLNPLPALDEDEFN